MLELAQEFLVPQIENHRRWAAKDGYEIHGDVTMGFRFSQSSVFRPGYRRLWYIYLK